MVWLQSVAMIGSITLFVVGGLHPCCTVLPVLHALLLFSALRQNEVDDARLRRQIGTKFGD